MECNDEPQKRRFKPSDRPTAQLTNQTPPHLHQPVRDVVTRSSKHFRGKFPSRKCGRTIYWESLHERDCIGLLEFHPAVRSYREQPSKETYYDTSLQPRTYFPDFEALLKNDLVVHIEVKPAARMARKDHQEKYGLIAKHYESQGRHFRVMTELELRCEPLRTNVRRLREHVKTALSPTVVQGWLHDLGCGPYRFDEAARTIGVTALLRLIATGHLYVNLNLPMEGNQSVWATYTKETDHDAFYF